MARSYSISKVLAGAPSTGGIALGIYMATAAGVRPKCFEYKLGSHATPADQATEFVMQRITTAAPTGGNAQGAGITALDPGDPVSLATAYDSSTGGAALSTVLDTVSLNLRATFRWVSAPGKEYVVPNTQYAGLGIVGAAQTADYAPDLNFQWEE
jgi:hypothetical protein